eukprot:3623397-Prymnesium_polylepis.1
MLGSALDVLINDELAASESVLPALRISGGFSTKPPEAASNSAKCKVTERSTCDMLSCEQEDLT